MGRVKNIVFVLIIGLWITFSTIVGIAHAKSGFISGHVYDVDGQTPIRGAIVRGVSVISPKKTATDINGYYILKELGTDIYLVEVSANGYVNASKGNVSVRESHITGNIDFILLKSGTISGAVFKEIDSSPISGSNVKIISTDNGNFWHSISENDGSFTIPGIIPGSYIICAESVGFAKSFVHNIKIEPGKEIENINIDLNSGGSVSGNIFEGDGVTPISNAMIFLYDINNPINFLKEISNALGEYSFNFIPVGEYLISCQIGENNFPKDGNLFITNGDNLSDVNFIIAQNTGLLNVKVKESDLVTPVGGAKVITFSMSIEGGYYYGETNIDGICNLSGIIAGTDYKIKVYKEGYITEQIENIIITGNQTKVTEFILNHE